MTLSQSTPQQPALFAAFDRIRIVNLPSRQDRRNEMERQLSRVELKGDLRVSYFPAVSCVDRGLFPRKGDHGCFQSHFTILKEAAEAGQSVLILEDDCDFLLPAISEFTLPETFDIFYGGYHAADPENLIESDIIGSHFMGFSASGARIAFDYFTRYLDPQFPPDPKAATQPGFNPEIRPPIDGGYVWMRRAHPELVTVFAMLSVQRPSRTDIGEPRWFDRMAGIRDVVEHLRRLRHRVSDAPRGMSQANAHFGARGD